MIEYFEVVRSFEAKGTILKQGDIVDGSGFRLKRQLVEQRFMKTFYGDPSDDAIKAETKQDSAPIVVRRRGRPRKEVANG